MHKRTHLSVTEGQAAGGRTRAPKTRTPRTRPNRRRRDWNKTLQSVAVVLVLGIAAALLFANPYFRVTQVRVDGAQTLTPQEVYAEARVPDRTNVFWMLRQPFARRLAQDPRIDHASRSIELPHRLVLTVAERQPRAVLFGRGQFWLLDARGVPYQTLDRPVPHVPLLLVSRKVMPDDVPLGRPLGAVWLPDAFRLLALLDHTPALSGAKIIIDQNANLCLNRRDNLQIRLGQGDALPQKVALADATVTAEGGALARQASYIDVSCPQQPVLMPRKGGDGADRSHDRTQSRTD